MKDVIIRAVAGNGSVRAFFASTAETVEAARRIHATAPTATAALGRLLTGAAMMGVMSKNDGESVTLRVKCDGILGGMLAASSNSGAVRGYTVNPDADMPPTPAGKLDVSGIVGNGTLTVIKDLRLKEPYVGQINLVSGEIAEDLTAYFAQSEQTPSAVALGVLVDTDGSVRQAGGFIIQTLPGVPEEVICGLEEKIDGIRSVTSMLDSGMDARGMLYEVLGGFGVEATEEIAVTYRCDCSRERVGAALISMGRKDLEKILAEDGRAEVCCQFCRERYEFGEDELRGMLADA